MAEASPAATETGCPPPLAWQEVLARVLREAETWYLDRNGYRVTGRTLGQGRPLYFLPGLGGTSDLLALLAWLLREHFRCVLIDYPDVQGRRVPTGRGAISALASDLLAVADQSGDEQIDLFATAFGSLTAIETLATQGQRVRRAVLHAPFAFRPLSVTERFLARVARRLPGRLRLVPFRTSLQYQNHRLWFPPFDETRFQFFLENTGQVPLAALGWRAEAMARADLRPGLNQIRHPLLVLMGEGEGRLAESCMETFRQGVSSSVHLERLSNAGQVPYLTHPHRFAALIREFLTS